MDNFRPNFSPPFFSPQFPTMQPPGMNFNQQLPPPGFTSPNDPVRTHNLDHFSRLPHMNWTNDFQSRMTHFDHRHLPPSMSRSQGFPVTNYHNATVIQPPMGFPRKPDNFSHQRIPVNSNRPPTVVESQEDLDKKWLKTFADNCEHRKESRQPRAKRIKISEAREFHARADFLINSIKSNLQSSDISQEKQKMKEELDKILSTLSEKSTITFLTHEVKKRKRKRIRAKRKRVADFYPKKQRQDRLNKKHQELDQWLLKREKQSQSTKREKQLQIELDSYLQEVRLKRDKLKKSLNLVQALTKLRKARKESALRKGQSISEAHDKVFMNAHTIAKANLLNSSSVCDEEETSLKSFLAKQRRIEEDEIKKQKLKQEEKKRTEWSRNRWEVLFGEKEEVDAFDVMWPIQELHKHASSTLSIFAHTRRQWDNFIVQSDDGSSIPTRWLEPVEPSEGWTEFNDPEKSAN